MLNHATTAALLLFLSPTLAQAAEDNYLDRFKGGWNGSGKVQRSVDSSPWNVRCNLKGLAPGENHISIQGNCRAAVIVQRQIGVELTYDPASGRYQGTYIGSNAGPARLSGTRKGDLINLAITWPRPINGDTRSSLTIRNDGSGTLRITVADNLTPGGPIQQTSDIVLQQGE
ncbi:hypothetical protein [Microvirga pudoricolor]|uniref:hypothetical protein n=1 Tax=Microvirga pudoricolor TaxID=2778729 RepID=UPI00194DEF41|nr:hypothetical protein [Microvirga pudoricolor]MBM6592855.1 hypothetical protein [Microvirga pudoricolor]